MEPEPTYPDAYARAGVDIDAGNRLVDAIKPVVAGTARTGSNPDIGGFGGLFDLAACKFDDPVLVAATDGVGTKLMLAIETGRLERIGIDLVAMCVNDLVVQGAEPLFFLDYYATSKLVPDDAARVIGGIAEGCRLAGCALIGGETAEMPGLYKAGDFDLAGFAVGAVERGGILPKPLKAGEVLIGLAASGIHSNGYSLLRKIVRDTDADLQAPAPFDGDRCLADILAMPTRIYTKSCLDLVRQGRVRAMAHITGGGLLENLPRMLGPDQFAVIDARSWPLPPVFAWLAQAGGLSAPELARTFNTGIGMVLAVRPDQADGVITELAQKGETAWKIGHIETRQGPAGTEIANTETAWPCSA